MDIDRPLTSSERSARRRAALLARGSGPGSRGPAVIGGERLARRRAKRRAQAISRHVFGSHDLSSSSFLEQAERDCEYLWRSQSADAPAMAFAEAITDELLADLDRAEGGR